jgi:very-short-patch-repair endonuclease
MQTEIVTPPGLPLAQGEGKRVSENMRYLFNDPALKHRRRDLRRNQTDAEKTFWAHVRNRRFHGLKFVRQYSAGPYILDFYCPDMNLAVELDGGQHNESKGKKYDAARTEYLRAHGIDVLRFWDNEVLSNIQGVLARVEERVTPPDLPLA